MRGRTSKAGEKLTTFIALSASIGVNRSKLNRLYNDQTVPYNEVVVVMKRIWFAETAIARWKELTKNY